MILLDTHVWLRWLDGANEPLPQNPTEMIEAADRVGVSAISCWEAAMLHKRNRIVLRAPFREWLPAALEASDIECAPIDREVAAKAALLPEHHRDPADRLIIATAILRDCQLLSLGKAFSNYQGLRLVSG